MTALWSYDDQPRRGDPLLPGATPGAIREALLPEERAKFDAAYEHALAVAREMPDLDWLFRLSRSTGEDWPCCSVIGRVSGGWSGGRPSC